jgi:pSer/pThr/pTyr-binding forkhead associated (FHA) protein
MSDEVDNSQNTKPVVPEEVFLILEGVRAFQFTSSITKVGRGHDNDLVIDDPRVSRKHLEIRVIRNRFVLFDLNSTGGTFLNGQRTNQGMLYSGDVISLAGVNLVFTQGSRLPMHSNAEKTIVGSGNRDTASFRKVS